MRYINLLLTLTIDMHIASMYYVLARENSCAEMCDLPIVLHSILLSLPLPVYKYCRKWSYSQVVL